MRLNESESVWMPKGSPEIWTLIPPGMIPPRNLDEAIALQAIMLERLVEDAVEDKEIDVANDCLEESPQLMALGLGTTWTDPDMPLKLMESPPVDGTLFHRMMKELEEAVKTPQPVESNQEARIWANDLTLLAWIGRNL